MDYKYIEQLLERYWECQTSAEEESILRAFFQQKDMPTHLARYQSLFEYEEQQTTEGLGTDFEARVLKVVGLEEQPADQPIRVVAAKHVTLGRRLRPLFRAAAAVAIVTLLGLAAQHSFTPDPSATGTGSWDYSQSAYKDSYQDPQEALEASQEVLQMFKEGAQTAVNDSTHNHDVPAAVKR